MHLNKHHPPLGQRLVMGNRTQPTAPSFSCLLLSFNGMMSAVLITIRVLYSGFCSGIPSASDRCCERLPLRRDAWLQESPGWSYENNLQHCLNSSGLLYNVIRVVLHFEAMHARDVISLAMRKRPLPSAVSCAALNNSRILARAQLHRHIQPRMSSVKVWVEPSRRCASGLSFHKTYSSQDKHPKPLI